MEKKNFKTMTPEERIEMLKNSKNPRIQKLGVMIEESKKMVKSFKTKEK